MRLGVASGIRADDLAFDWFTVDDMWTSGGDMWTTDGDATPVAAPHPRAADSATTVQERHAVVEPRDSGIGALRKPDDRFEARLASLERLVAVWAGRQQGDKP